MKLKHATNIDDILNLIDQYRILIDSLNTEQQFIFCKFIPSAQLEIYTNHLFFSTVNISNLIGVEKNSNINLAIEYNKEFQPALKYDNFSYTIKEKSILPSLIPYVSSEKYSKAVLAIQECLSNSISLINNYIVVENEKNLSSLDIQKFIDYHGKDEANMLMILKSMKNIENASYIIKEYGLERLQLSIENFEFDMKKKMKQASLQSDKWSPKRHFLLLDLVQFVDSFKKKDLFLISIEKILLSDQLLNQLPINSQTSKRNKI